MKPSHRNFAATFVALVLALVLAPGSRAQCGGFRKPVAFSGGWHSQFKSSLAQPRLLQVALANDDDGDGDHDPTIVGLWHIKFVSHGRSDVPDGVEFDAGYAQWHSDHTEIMNSGGRSPITSSFCLGVWKPLGEREYLLNHFAVSWNETGSKIVGPANIRERVTLSPDGNRFSGTFTIDQYDETGNRLAHIQGSITGTRVTVNTPSESVF